jgi:hypothetical protein
MSISNDTTIAQIEWDKEKDRYDNVVSIITLGNGKVFRMVCFSKQFHPKQRYAIYAGRNKFIKCKTYSPNNDCMEIECEIAGYSVMWGDGDNIGVQCPPLGPDLSEKLGKIVDDDFDEVIITVIDAIQNIPNMWESK